MILQPWHVADAAVSVIGARKSRRRKDAGAARPGNGSFAPIVFYRPFTSLRYCCGARQANQPSADAGHPPSGWTAATDCLLNGDSSQGIGPGKALLPITADSFIAARASLHIVHHVPGRLRLRISPAALQRSHTHSIGSIRQFIEGLDGVQRLRLSPATLSAIVEYDDRVVAPDLWDSLIKGPEHGARDAFAALTRPARCA